MVLCAGWSEAEWSREAGVRSIENGKNNFPQFLKRRVIAIWYWFPITLDRICKSHREEKRGIIYGLFVDN